LSFVIPKGTDIVLSDLLKSNIAIVGGGKFCKNLIELLASEDFEDPNVSILGVADVNDRAEGLLYAAQLGIFTTSDFKDLYQLENLQFIVELTGETGLASVLNQTKPDGVKIVDHVDSRTIWTSLQVEREKRKALKALRQSSDGADNIDGLFEQFADHLGEVVNERSNRYVEIERELIESEEALSQIIEGSTIPTFVINKNHVVTHWNTAMENLTGAKAESMVGTTRQSWPFWGEERPTMADVILDQIGRDEIKKLYGEKWRESVLIEEAYEAELFFPRLGDGGKWCWFTAAPIKGHDGTIVGAIETLWDKTEDKKAEEEREYHTRELSTLCSIYSSLNAPTDLESRINEAVRELLNFLSADGICIYMLDQNGQYVLRHSQGLSDNACKKVSVLNEKSIIHRVAQTNEFTIYENLPEGCLDEICLLEEEKIVSLAYVPISNPCPDARPADPGPGP
jgi:PAS domain-containing protein